MAADGCFGGLKSVFHYSEIFTGTCFARFRDLCRKFYAVLPGEPKEKKRMVASAGFSLLSTSVKN